MSSFQPRAQDLPAESNVVKRMSKAKAERLDFPSLPLPTLLTSGVNVKPTLTNRPSFSLSVKCTEGPPLLRGVIFPF